MITEKSRGMHILFVQGRKGKKKDACERKSTYSSDVQT